MENEIIVAKKASGWVKALKIALVILAVAAAAVLVYKKFFKKKKAEELVEAEDAVEAELCEAEEALVVEAIEEAPFEVAADAVIDNAENMEA